ncbi:hypothetical protein ANTQUA_LOCUS6828 [Anthophora quadrimaculata]
MCRFLCFALLFAILPFTFQQALDERNCACAVFSSQMPELIIERTLPYNVTCDSEGEDKCQQLCVAVAETARERAPQMICEKLNTHVENLQVAVYAKVCNMTNWKFTGLKGLDPICCHEGNSVRCEHPTSVV